MRHGACLLVFFFLASAFVKSQSFVTNGSASNSGGGCYQLTPDQPGQAGTIFSASPIDLNQPFNLSARYNFGCKDVNGADGIVFIFATSNTALGTGGGALGYQGITPSIAIEVDDYQNGNFGDPAEDHMAVISMGSVDHNAATGLVGPVTIPNVEDCNDHCFSVSWNPQSQTLSAILDGNFISYSGDIIGNIFGGNSSVYYGFSSGTGSLSNPHVVCVGPPQLVPMNDVSICPGESIQLQADPNGDSWFWSPDPSLSSFTVSDPTATPLATTTYNVTITYSCGSTLTDDVIVNVIPPPVATASNNGPVCVGETLQLSATGGVSYSWSGPLFYSSSEQNPSIPNIDLINAGTYTVTVTDANGCTNTASTNVVVHQPPVVAIVPPPLPFCEDAPVQTLQAIPSGGTWGGVANQQGQINPAALGPGLHQVTYIAIDPNGCIGTDDIFIEVAALPDVQILPAGPFCDTDPVQTLQGTPGNGIWGGAANPLGEVNPGALGPGSHMVTYQVIDGLGCEATDTFNVVVLAGTTVTISPAGPFCPSAGPQTLTATPPGGVWGGAANAQGQVNPAAIGPGVHQVTYSYSGPGVCAGSATATVTVLCQPFASISGNEIICEGETATLTGLCGGTGVNGVSCFNGPYTITYDINGNAQAPITVSSSPFSLPAGIPGVYTIVDVTSGNGCTNTGTGSAEVTVAGAPEVQNLDIACDSTNTSYIVTFEITGGDPGSYSVTGSPGNLTTTAPYIFTSQPVLSGSAYSFVVNDANDCDPTTLSGNFSCQCETEAGTMNLTPITVCLGETITATHNGNEVLDGNDLLFFVLHSSNGNSLGAVFATNSTPQFSLVPPMMSGVTYYISAVAGNDDGNGGVDLMDPCLSVSFGTPVIFRALPTASIGSDVEICAGETATLTFALTGNAPFDVTYSDGSQNFTLNNIFNGHTIQVSPAMSTTYSLVSVDDNSNPVCSTQGGNNATVTVWEPATVNQVMEICEGESVQLGGAPQTASGTYTDTLATVHGCDSVIVTALTVHPLDTVFLNETSCNPAQVGVFTQNLTNQNGCDSTVITTVVFSQTDTTLLASTTCDPMLAGVFTNNFVTPEGCDSIVIETVTLLPSDTTYLSDTNCDPAQTGVFTQILTNQFGCDSTIITTVVFSQTDTTLLTSATCDPMLAGVFTSNFVTPEGCDSIVIETVTLLPSDTTYLSGTNCDPAQTGVFTQNLFNQFGCDSLVITTVTFSEADTTLLASTTCDPALAGIFTQNLSNQSGCDSLVIETVTLLPSDTTYLASTTCEPASAGVFTQNLTNQNGCDSLVIETVTLLTPDECGLEITLTGDTISCSTSAGSIALEITQGQAPFTYAWQSASGANGSGSTDDFLTQIQGLPGGSYSVTVTSANGLTASAQASLVQMTPPVLDLDLVTDFGGYGVSCHGAADGSIAASATGGTMPYTYFWSNNGQGQGQDNLPAGSYSVTVSGPYSCTAEAEILLPEPPPLALTFAVSDLDCFGENDGAVVAEPSGGVTPYQFSLNGGAWQNAAVFTGLSAGTYEITAQDANGCEASEILWINAPIPVSVELGDAQEIDFGETTTLTALVNLPFDSLASVIWSPMDSSECPGCLTQPVAPVITTTYTVSITAENGCEATDQTTVFVDRRKQVYVPSAFSPNDDGLNDVFLVFAKPNTVARVKSFLVFSRWGETIFQYYNFPPNDPAYGWDGRHRGEEMNPAVFVWFAEVEFLDGQTLLFEGDVTLVR